MKSAPKIVRITKELRDLACNGWVHRIRIFNADGRRWAANYAVAWVSRSLRGEPSPPPIGFEKWMKAERIPVAEDKSLRSPFREHEGIDHRIYRCGRNLTFLDPRFAAMLRGLDTFVLKTNKRHRRCPIVGVSGGEIVVLVMPWLPPDRRAPERVVSP